MQLANDFRTDPANDPRGYARSFGLTREPMASRVGLITHLPGRLEALTLRGSTEITLRNGGNGLRFGNDLGSAH